MNIPGREFLKEIGSDLVPKKIQYVIFCGLFYGVIWVGYDLLLWTFDIQFLKEQSTEEYFWFETIILLLIGAILCSLFAGVPLGVLFRRSRLRTVIFSCFFVLFLGITIRMVVVVLNNLDVYYLSLIILMVVVVALLSSVVQLPILILTTFLSRSISNRFLCQAPKENLNLGELSP